MKPIYIYNLRLIAMSDNPAEYIARLFNTISSDPYLQAELKISLLQLQLPIHKLSQNDPSFISNSKHPARRTLFITKKLSKNIKNNHGAIKIDRILSKLYNSQPNANDFLSVNQQLERFMASLQNNSPKLPNKKHQIKSIVNSNIKQCINGLHIPARCQDLVLKLWPTALFFILKNHGGQSPQWHNAINTYSELLNSIQAIENATQYCNLKDCYMDIVRRNNHILKLYNPEDIIEAAMKLLLTHFNQALSNSNFITNNKNINTSSTQYKISSLPTFVKPGTWCEIFIDENTPTRRLRLSLINSHTGMLIFVNRKGIKMLEKDAAVFAEELTNGLSKVYKHDTLFTKPTTKPQFRKIG